MMEIHELELLIQDAVDNMFLVCSKCGRVYDANLVYQQSGELVCEDCYDRELGED